MPKTRRKYKIDLPWSMSLDELIERHREMAQNADEMDPERAAQLNISGSWKMSTVHQLLATELLAWSEDEVISGDSDAVMAALARAQVHATLALSCAVSDLDGMEVRMDH